MGYTKQVRRKKVNKLNQSGWKNDSDDIHKE